MTIKIVYFDFPGRAEVSRLLLTAGNVEFEDYRMKREEWPAIKPTTPFGQVPFMEVDGKMIAQTAAIVVYCAKVAGLYPEDPLIAAQQDQICMFLEDIAGVLTPTWAIKDPEEKIKARQELLKGALGDKLKTLEKSLDGKDYVAGDKLSYGDISVFCFLSGMMTSGFIDGIPTTVLDDYPVLKAFRNKIAQEPFVLKYYAESTAPMAAAFRPDAE